MKRGAKAARAKGRDGLPGKRLASLNVRHIKEVDVCMRTMIR
jgi:hypothetical protein